MSHAKGHPHEKPHHPHWPLACLLFAYVALLGLASVHVSSTWLNITTGARILGERAIPRVDHFSYTAAGQPWTTESWLSDVAFYLIHTELGAGGLIFLKSLAAASAFALLLPVNPASPLIAASVLALGAVAAWTGFAETPAILDLLMLAILLRLLRPRKGFHWGVLAQVFVLEGLWANLHGTTAVLGLWLIGLKVFKASLRTVKRERLGYWALLGAAAVALALNPLGYGVVPHMFDGGESWAAWQPLSPWFNLYSLFALAGAAACYLCLQQEFFLTMTAATLLGLSLIYPGLRPLYILSACPVITLGLGHFFRPRSDTPGRVLRWGLAMAALLAAHTALVALPLGRSRGYAAVSLDGALHYLRDNGVKGRMFNEPESGARLLAADRAVFVDWRARLYGASFMKDAARWAVSFRQLCDVFHFDYAVILNRRGRYPARVLDEDPDWRLAYADDDALVYIRLSGDDGRLVAGKPKPLVAPNSPFPEALDTALARPKTAAQALAELDGWLVQAPDAVQVLIWKAYALDHLGLGDKAERLIALAEARPRLRWDPELQAALGQVHERRGNVRRARALYLRSSLIARRRGDSALESAVLDKLAALDRKNGDEPRARDLERRRQELASAPVDEP